VFEMRFSVSKAWSAEYLPDRSIWTNANGSVWKLQAVEVSENFGGGSWKIWATDISCPQSACRADGVAVPIKLLLAFFSTTNFVHRVLLHQRILLLTWNLAPLG
jgi:hypothetical protein